MTQIAVVPLSIAAACLIAALYGALHDIVTYWISPEYYTRFKFIQFGVIDLAMPDVVKAMWVGVRASWWMGVPLGGGIGCVLLFAPRGHKRRLFLMATGCVVFCAASMAIGFDGLIEDYSSYYMPAGVTDRTAFLHVGSIHNGSYLGAALGMVIALCLLPVLVWRARVQ